ncbi:transporter substrate-binding domain-containing protein [Microbaculum marinum]|uniref:Transporter substrate-binding domain-containing protein n=1 Tax=Microbaculum marinum TaxID=1764581 RepID=A0AAW9RFJ7_9HYPH
MLAGVATLVPLPAAAVDLPAEVSVPSFWDPAHRMEKPDLSEMRAIRILAEAENPPFAFIGADGLPTGFSVELARAICLELEIPCTVQALRWNYLAGGIDAGLGDAVIGSFAISADSRARFDFSNRFLTRPAHFVVRRDAAEMEILPEGLAGKRVGVQKGTAHEAYLRAYFPGSILFTFDTENEARAALKDGDIDALFADGLNSSIWLNGVTSENCCRFAGGPFTEARYFGEGLAIAVAPGNDKLREAFDFALARIQQDGTYREIFLRYFPVSFY